MGHQKNNLSMQITLQLKDKLAIGEKKHDAKKDGTMSDKIFSYGTYESYKKHCNYFADYCKQEHGCKTLAQCRQYVPEWLERQKENGLSPFTVKLEASALAKLYGCRNKDFGVEMPRCSRSGITRSRGAVARDKNYNEERHSEDVAFFRSTGLRRSELSKLTGDRLVFRDGAYYIHLDKTTGTKGGKERYALIIGDVESVVNRMKDAGDGLVFPDGINTNADIHGYRSDYATAIYKANARPFEVCKASPFWNKEHSNGKGKKKGGFDKNSVYWCRGDRKGVWLDKRAMEIASKSLGHNRISVVGEHYIR